MTEPSGFADLPEIPVSDKHRALVDSIAAVRKQLTARDVMIQMLDRAAAEDPHFLRWLRVVLNTYDGDPQAQAGGDVVLDGTEWFSTLESGDADARVVEKQVGQ